MAKRLEYTARKTSFLSPLKEDPKYIVIITGLVLLGVGVFLFSGDVGILGNLVLAGVFIVSLPYFFISYLQYVRIKEMESHFPSFLRNVADSVRSGSTISQAIDVASKLDYGRLTPEIRKFASQLSWGVPFRRSSELFIQRMKKSDLISKAMRIMLEAQGTGGNIAPVMESVADAVIMMKETEYEQVSLLKEHVVMMYAIYFIFLGIVMALTGILLPILDVGTSLGAASTSLGVSGFSSGSPCDLCRGLQCGVCDGLTGLGSVMGFGEGIEAYYKGLFFAMILIQGFFAGLVAGQIGNESLIVGLRHSLIMSGVGFGIFVITSRLGIV